MSDVALNGLVASPAAAAVLVLLARRRERLAVGLGVLGSLVALGWSVWAAWGYDAGVGAGGNTTRVAWVESLRVDWYLGVDGISAPLVLMTTLVFACCLFSLVRHAPRRGGRVNLAALLLLIESGVLGTFMALDMVLFFLFFEVALIPMWYVISLWGDEHDERGRRRAAIRFLVFTVTGSALMLVGFLLVGASAGTFDIVAVAASYDTTGAAALAASLLVGLGLAVKTPLWPLHIWLPDAHAKAPTVGSVVLAAVLLKLGTYGFLRFWLPVTSPDWPLVPVVAALGVVGIVYAALACLAQTDLKRLIAYSSVGHMGFVVLAAATYTVGGVQAAVYASVAHGLITGLLFFVAGAVKDRYDTADLGQLRALYGAVPRLGGVFAFGAMASLGLPGLAGFWGEMLAIRAAVDQGRGLPETTYLWLAVIAAVGVILTSAYFLAVMRSMLQGGPVAPVAPVAAAGASAAVPARAVEGTLERVAPVVEAPTAVSGADRRDLDGVEWLTWLPLIVLTLVFGVAPGLLLEPVAEAASVLLRRS